MTASTYRLTVKFAPSGVPYFNEKKKEWETSTWGHVWLEARKPGEALDAKPSFCAGWSTGRTVFAKGEDNLGGEDWKNYQNGNGKQISSITVDISKEQFEKLQDYPALAAAGKIPGFGKVYDAGDNSCIDFSGKGLGFIGLAGRDFDGSGLFWARPDKQVNAFLEQIAEHRRKGAALVVEHRGRSYTFEENERDVKKFWRTIDPYWYLAQDENQREQPYQYAQTIDGFTPELQVLHEKARTLLAEFNQREGIYQSATEFDNTAAFITAAMQKAKMTDADVIGKMDGKLHVIHDTEELDVAIVDPKTAAQTPVADSVAQSKQTEQQFEYETQQRQYAQSQSRGMVLS